MQAICLNKDRWPALSAALFLQHKFLHLGLKRLGFFGQRVAGLLRLPRVLQVAACDRGNSGNPLLHYGQREFLSLHCRRRLI